jgi:hypothetical protein
MNSAPKLSLLDTYDPFKSACAGCDLSKDQVKVISTSQSLWVVDTSLLSSYPSLQDIIATWRIVIFQAARIDMVAIKQTKISSKELVRLQNLKKTMQAITFGFHLFSVSGWDLQFLLGLIGFGHGLFWCVLIGCNRLPRTGIQQMIINLEQLWKTWILVGKRHWFRGFGRHVDHEWWISFQFDRIWAPIAM